MMMQVARAFKALKVALSDLESFYDQLTDPQYPQLNIHQRRQHHLTFPYNRDFRTSSGADATLAYIKKLNCGRYVFRARMEYNDESTPDRDVIVKFSESYSKECHEVCHGLGYAPELIACEWIAGGWYFVVMELLDDNQYVMLETLQFRREITQSLAKAVETAAEAMHDKGFVHGDLRPPNIMVSPDDSIKIIDFDCSGKIGEAVYPPFRNRKNIEWHPDAKLGAVIRPEHDMFMLKSAFNVEQKKRKSPRLAGRKP